MVVLREKLLEVECAEVHEKGGGVLRISHAHASESPASRTTLSRLSRPPVSLEVLTKKVPPENPVNSRHDALFFHSRLVNR